MQSSKDDEILFVISGDAIKVNAWDGEGSSFGWSEFNT